jgi:hypothetical protein
VPFVTSFRLWRRQLQHGWLAALASLPFAASVAAEAPRPVSFLNDVVPVLTKAGCNSGACHAKAGQGQNGFQLSLLGFEPQEDFEHLVKEARGRRVFAASPEQSLLLRKAANVVPHGGGLRLDPASEGYRILRAWLQQGTPNDLASAPKVVALDVQPAKKTLKPKSEQQLKVTARFADGKSRDVTAIALYEANDRAMADASEAGRVKVLDQPGNVAVMVRYQDQAAVFNVSVPLGAPVKHLPPERNFIDRLVFANLKQLGIPPSPVCDDPAPRLARHRGPAAHAGRGRGVPREPEPREARPTRGRAAHQPGLRGLLRGQVDRAAQEQARRHQGHHRELRLPLVGA